ncbi:hypothetical protein [Phenylobacterium sp.]|uniref:hypothetical protein n=1 Tax=Phenylobacterium sp. TaxID=1871053 RepID=UPI0035B139B8
MHALSVLGALSIVPALVVYSVWSEEAALRADWTIDGPACPVVARAAPAAVGRKPPKVFRYGQARFERAFGAVYCAALPEKGLFTRAVYRVCQFNNPGAVTVEVGAVKTIFQPPPGGRVTVTVRRGKANCVVGGWFSY